MKKALLPIIALCAWAAPAFADEVYGTTPETAKPFPAAGGWFVPDLATAPAEAYFTITNNGATPAQWGDAPGDPSLRQIFVYLCDGGQEALQRSEGTNSWVLFPGQEYLVKIVPQAAGLFGFSAPMAFPPAWEGQYKYYPKDITETRYENRVQAAGTTKWYLYDVPYASQITTNTMLGLPNMDITTVEAIHIQCPGGTNTGSGLMGPYVKAGKNIIGVTVAETAAADVEYVVALNAMITLNCSNNLLRGQSITLDAKNTYPDAYYTVDRYFIVPEDGTYTFINHGAKGTILNVGLVKRTDPENQYKYECDWSGIKSATVGNDDAVVVVENLKAGDIVAVQS
ncbi:MAG: hypothetical protein K2K77_01650, partial [Duncaniella sp.]|nr:hypothetical protein [Duncaniella sp.]